MNNSIFYEMYSKLTDFIFKKNNIYTNVTKYNEIFDNIVVNAKEWDCNPDIKLSMVKTSKLLDTTYEIIYGNYDYIKLILVIPDIDIIKQLPNDKFYSLLKHLFKLVSYYYRETAIVLNKFREINKYYEISNYIEDVYPILFLLDNGKDIKRNELYNLIPKWVKTINGDRFIDLHELITDCIDIDVHTNIDRLFNKAELLNYIRYNE